MFDPQEWALVQFRCEASHVDDLHTFSPHLPSIKRSLGAIVKGRHNNGEIFHLNTKLKWYIFKQVFILCFVVFDSYLFGNIPVFIFNGYVDVLRAFTVKKKTLFSI